MAAMAFYGFYTSLGAGRFSEAPCSRSERPAMHASVRRATAGRGQ